MTNLIYNAPPRCKLGGFLLRFDAGLFGGYEEAEASYGSERNSIDDFIANANRFIDIQELTPEIVHAFISKIHDYESNIP